MSEGGWPFMGGAVGETLRHWDRSSCELGIPASWPHALKSALQLILPSDRPMVLIWGRHGILLCNDAFGVIAGDRQPALLGRRIADAWPEFAAFCAPMLASVEGGSACSHREVPLPADLGTDAVQAWLDIDCSPVFDETGDVAGVLAILADQTERVRARDANRDLAERLHRRETELAHVQRIGGIGGLEVDLRDGFRNRRSPEYLLVHGLPPEAAHESHENWVARIHPQERAMVESHFRETVAGSGTDYRAEYRITRPSDGAERWISAVARIERDETGRAIRLVGAHLDVTERKEAEAQQQLLAQELSHRVKNSMTMIQAIASQTLRSATSLEQASETFSARLSALARAHDLLVGGNGSSAPLAAIVAGVIGIQGDPTRFSTSGPDIMLAPKPALSLTLILHELATNAVKYGALSNAAGTVGLHWRVDEIEGETQFRLRWQEQGGPSVKPPQRRGFGSRLIERTFPSVRACAETAYLTGGLVFTFDCPLDALRSQENDQA